MIVTRRIALRIALIIIFGAVVQAAFFSQLSVLGAAPNSLPVIVVSLGLLGGSLIGAVCGFAMGLLVDSMLFQTLGVSSLVLLWVGYLAGRYREGFEIDRAYVPALIAGGLTLLGSAGFAVLQLMLGVETDVSLLVLREIFVQSLLAILLAFGIYPLLRRILAPALIDYTPRRRRIRIPGLGRRRARRARPARAVTASEGASGRGLPRTRGGHGRRRNRIGGRYA
jgi:rod shape-determining protein MreD